MNVLSKVFFAIAYAIAVLGCAPSIAHAHLGETEYQIKARYGGPIAQPSAISSDVGLSKAYSSDGFFIVVTFLDGKSAREMFAKLDKSELTAGELQILLDENGGGCRWDDAHLAGQNEMLPGAKEWRSTDQRSRVAFYDANTHALFVTTQDYIDRLPTHTKPSAPTNLKIISQTP